MSNFEDYNQVLPAMKALNSSDVKQPSMPVDVFIQEGENLYQWCQSDKDELERAALAWMLVEGLPAGLGALREAESRWNADRYTKEDAEKEWKQKAPDAYDLRDVLLHHFRHAYRNYPDLLGRVRAIAEGSGDDDLVQDLNDLAILGQENPESLEEISFDMAQLNEAATLSAGLAELRAIAIGERAVQNEAKELRDRAYTLCKNAIDEIRTVGQYVFWRNPARLKGYTSAYNRRKNSKRNKADEEANIA